MTPLHQGKYIEDRIKNLGFTKKSVADKLETSRQNLDNILRKKELSPSRLKKLGTILHEDLFETFFNRPSPSTSSEVNEPNSHHEYELKGQVVVLERLLEKKVKKDHKELADKVAEKQEALLKEIKDELQAINTFIRERYNWENPNKSPGTETEQ